MQQFMFGKKLINNTKVCANLVVQICNMAWQKHDSAEKVMYNNGFITICFFKILLESLGNVESNNGPSRD